MFPEKIAHVVLQALKFADNMRASAVEIAPHEYCFHNCRTDREEEAIEVIATVLDDDEMEIDCVSLEEY
jgi:hypothetical protein